MELRRDKGGSSYDGSCSSIQSWKADRQGTYYHVFGVALPLKYEVKSGATWNPQTPEASAMIDMLAGQPQHVIGPGTFSYRWMQDQTDSHSTAWLLMFYDTIPLLSVTAPPGFFTRPVSA
jgi:hypothetical protein